MSLEIIADLEKQLAEKVASLDAQRQQEKARFDKEREERRQLEEAERHARMEELRRREAYHTRKAAQLKEEEEKRARTAKLAQIELEHKQNEADELVREQKRKLQWLLDEIAKVEFAEEQHKKSLESDNKPSVVSAEQKINVEQPVAPVNLESPGDAVKGTEGSTPSSPLMSSHLKSILRQAVRSY